MYSDNILQNIFPLNLLHQDIFPPRKKSLFGCALFSDVDFNDIAILCYKSRRDLDQYKPNNIEVSQYICALVYVSLLSQIPFALMIDY